MATTADPETVREIARKAMEQAASRLPYYPEGVTGALVAHGIDGRDMERWAAYGNAVREYIKTATVTVSWPTERDLCGVQLPADSAARLGVSPDTTCTRPDGHATHNDGNGVLWVGRSCAEQDERDCDVRAVAALAAADNDDELDRAVSDLIARFADRIEALEARDANGGEGR